MRREQPPTRDTFITVAIPLTLTGASVIIGYVSAAIAPLGPPMGDWFLVGLLAALVVLPLSVVWFDLCVLLLLSLLSISYAGSLGPFDLMLLVLIGVGIVTRRINLSALRQPGGVSLLAGLFVTGYATSFFFVDDFQAAIISAGNLFLRLALFAFMRVYVVTPQRARIVLEGYAISAILGAVTVLGPHLGLGDLPGGLVRLDPAGRLTGLLGDPNVFGAFYVPLFVILISETVDPRLWAGRFWKLPLLALSFAMVILSFSRGAWLALAVAATVYILLRAQRGSVKPLLTIGLLGIGLVLVGRVVLDLPRFEGYFEQRLDLQPYDADRFYFQARAIAESGKRIFGVGPGNAGSVLGYGTHNLFLIVLLENGWLAFMSFALFVLFLVRRLWRKFLEQSRARFPSAPKLPADAILASIIGVLVNSLVIDSQGWRILWFVLGLAWGHAYETSIRHRKVQPPYSWEPSPVVASGR